MQTQKPNKPVFSKGSPGQSPLLPPPHSSRPLLLLWCEKETARSLRKSSCQPQRAHSFLHAGIQSLQIGGAAYFVLPPYPHIKPTDVLTLKGAGADPHLSLPPSFPLFLPPPPRPSERRPTSGSCWVTSVMDRFSSQHVKSVSTSDCLCLRLIRFDSVLLGFETIRSK